VAAVIYFTSHRRKSRVITVFDSDDRDYLRYLLNCYSGGWDEQEVECQASETQQVAIPNNHTTVNHVCMGEDGEVVTGTHVIWYRDRDPIDPRLPPAADTPEIREEIKWYHEWMKSISGETLL
jgi:hypothetical protein